MDDILKDSDQANESRFARVEDEISRITSDVAELSKFIRLNYSGFLKVLFKQLQVLISLDT